MGNQKIKTLEAIASDLATWKGLDESEESLLLKTLQQTKERGAVGGDEFRIIQELAPSAFSYLNISPGELRKCLSKGFVILWEDFFHQLVETGEREQ